MGRARSRAEQPGRERANEWARVSVASRRYMGAVARPLGGTLLRVAWRGTPVTGESLKSPFFMTTLPLPRARVRA
jgi:hypothetical protein